MRGDNPGIEFGVLSEPIVRVGDTAVDLPARPRAVLVALLLEANRDVSIDRLIDQLWGEDPPKTARNSVARFVADLRRALGDHGERVETVAGGYRASVTADELDLLIVDQVLRRRSHGEQISVEVLEAALDVAGMHPNPVVSELSGGGAIERTHTEYRIALIEAIAEERQRAGEHRELLALLEEAVALHPYHEALWGALMVSLAETGRPTEALRAGQRLRGLLTDIGVLPSDRIVTVEEEILAGMQGDVAAGRADADAAGAARINDPGTTLIGRIDDLKDLHRRLQSNRLVSVIGLGGSGKTRLALATIRAEEATGTTVHQVALGQVSDPEAVLPTVGAALGLAAGATFDLDGILGSLSPDPFLLVLDNCEHLSAPCAALVAGLLESAPQARILTTSRVSLGVAGEHLWPIAPLDQEPPSDEVPSAATRLFLERAEAQFGPGRVDPSEIGLVEDIGRGLEGLPLAIEVAAAQLAFGSVSDLHSRICRPADAGSVEPDPATDILGGVLDWTWSSLTLGQQTLLARLSVFTSGATDDSIETVCGVSGTNADDLARLVGSGIVTVAETPNGRRYEIVAAVRDFAAARLAERHETQPMLDRLSGRMIELAEADSMMAYHLLASPSQRLLPELGNLTTVLEHLRSHQRHVELVALAFRISGMWTNHRFAGEILRWLGPLSDHESLPERTRSLAAAATCVAHHTLGNLDQIEPTGTLALELAAGEPLDFVPTAAGYLSVWSVVAGTPRPTEEYTRLSFDAAPHTPSGDLNTGAACMYRAQLAFTARRYDDALEWYERSSEYVTGPGRHLLIVETNTALCRYLLGSRTEAADAAARWESQPHTDHWHYLVDVIRAIIVGGAGEPERATAEFAAAVRAQPAAMVWGQADIVQIAFALLASFRGEQDLADDLFETANNRDFNLVAFTVEHLLEQRGLEGTDEEWLTLAAEQFTRVVPRDVRADRASTTENLLSWWSGAERASAGLRR